MTFRKASVCAIVVAIVVAGPLLYLRHPPQEILAPDDPRYKDVLCGPIALSTALGRLGIVRPPAAIASACQVTVQGVRMTELVNAATALQEVQVVSGRFDWEELRKHDGTAVLHVNDDHFVCVDPREQSRSGFSGSMRVYQSNRPALWWTRNRLSEVWSGRAFLLQKNSIRLAGYADSSTTEKSQIEWESCYLDNGVLDEEVDDSAFTFRFRNIGADVLTIGDISTTCGCMDAEVSDRELAPGESASLRFGVDLAGKDGFVFQQATVVSNDPDRPVTVLSMGVGIPRRRIVSSDLIRLSDLPQRSETHHELLIADPGFDGFEIDRDKVRVHGLPEHLQGRLTIDLRHQRVGDHADHHASRLGFRVESTDQLVTLTVQSDDGCPTGPYSATAVVPVMAGRYSRDVNVTVTGQVVPSVQPWPRIALLTLDDNRSAETLVRFRSLTDRPVRITGHTLQKGSRLSVHPGQADLEFIVRGTFEAALPSNPYREIVQFKLSDGTSVPLPVSAFRPRSDSL